MRLALIHMDEPNLGDPVIYECVTHLVQDAARDLGLADLEIVPVNIGEWEYAKTSRKSRPTLVRKVRTFVRKTGKKLLERRLRVWLGRKWLWQVAPEWVERRLMSIWLRTRRGRHYVVHEREKLETVDAILFCGGGLIKYRKQDFPFFLRDIIALAESRGIPVTMNSVGVEGYEENHLFCRMLKTAVNSHCVKFISCRDDFETLRDHYVENPDVEIASVCDPALWSAETYGVTAVPEKGLVGVNVIRPSIFGDYGHSAIDRERCLRIYEELISRTLADGSRIRLFTNGAKCDAMAMKKLLKRLPDLRDDPRVEVCIPDTTEGLVRTIASCERILAVRLHAAIIATSLGVPNFNLVWNGKQVHFGRLSGRGEWFVDPSGLSDGELHSRLMSATGGSPAAAYRQTVRNGIRRQLELLAGGRTR